LILAALCLLMRDPRGVRARSEAAHAKPKIKFADVIALYRIRSYTLNTAAMAAMTFAMGGLSFWVPRYLFKYRAADFEGHPDLGQINFAFGAITAAAGLLATIIGGWVGDRVRRRFPSSYFLVSAITIFFAFPATVLMLRTPFPDAWIWVFLAIFFLFFNTGPANAALANVTPPATRATAFALNILAIHIFGDAVSPPLIGWIAGQTNMNFAFLVVSATMVVASAFWLFGVPHLARETAAISAIENAS
jgi:MFS family permease